MKKIAQILFDTVWGAPAAFASALFLYDIRFIFRGPLLHGWKGVDCVLEIANDGYLLLCAVILLASFVLLLVRRRWWALAQLGLVLGILFAFGLLQVPVALASAYVSYHGPGGRDWHATPADAPFPFAIECRRNNPVAVEYDKRVAFPSGKRVGLYLDTGGYARTTVHAIGSGGYALVEGGTPPHTYRVDPGAETVEVLIDRHWYRLPDGETPIAGWDAAIPRDSGRPAGDSPSGWRRLGTALPDGRFEPERHVPGE